LPAHTVVADGEVKLLMLGFALVVNDAVLLDDTAVEQLEPFWIAVIVTVLEPALLRLEVVNVPLLAPIVSVAVALLTVLVPLTL
jgi:hypothetical protein